jgi:hypothetical protein
MTRESVVTERSIRLRIEAAEKEYGMSSGEILRHERIYNYGVSQVKMGEFLGLTQVEVSAIENSHIPAGSRGLKILAFLDIS